MERVVQAFLETERNLRLGNRLGQGPFGEVWEVQSESGVCSAVKVALDVIDSNNPKAQQLVSNIKVAIELSSHPHLVSLLDFWIVSGYLVIQSELAKGGDLLRALVEYQRQGEQGIPLDRLLLWMKEAAEALDFLHENGICHANIKPQNLLLFHEHVKIADLGLVKIPMRNKVSRTQSSATDCLPWEVWEGYPTTPTVDLYSLAATYVKLRTGRDPFGTNLDEILRRQKLGEVITEGLEDWEIPLLLDALAPDHASRFRGGLKAWVRELSLASEQSSGHRGAFSERPTSVSQTGFGLNHDSSNKSEIVVDAEGSGDFKTLEEAISQCSPGSRIRLGEGTYVLKQPLEVTKPIELAGAGADSTWIVCYGEGYGVKFCGHGLFQVSGITFQHSGKSWVNVVMIESGKIRISNCCFRDAVSDTKKGKGGVGLLLSGTVFGQVKECYFVNNDSRGITIHDSARPDLEGNICERNEMGIAYFDSASGSARNNVCRRNRYHGIAVNNRATPTLEGNTCEDNGVCGIAYADQAGGTAQNNICRGNKEDQIWVGKDASPYLKDNEGEVTKQTGWFGQGY